MQSSEKALNENGLSATQDTAGLPFARKHRLVSQSPEDLLTIQVFMRQPAEAAVQQTASIYL